MTQYVAWLTSTRPEHSKALLGIAPMPAAFKPGLVQQLRETVKGSFVGIFSVDALTQGARARTIGPAHGHGTRGLQVHFDA